MQAFRLLILRSPATQGARRRSHWRSLDVARFGEIPYLFTTPEDRLWHAEDWRANVWRPRSRLRDWHRFGCTISNTPELHWLPLQASIPLAIARRAGHSSVTFTYDRYGHLFPEADTVAAKLEAVRTGGVAAGLG